MEEMEKVVASVEAAIEAIKNGQNGNHGRR